MPAIAGKGPFLAGAVGGGEPVLTSRTGINQIEAIGSGTQTAGVRFVNNGSRHVREGGSYSIDVAGEWWSAEPQTGIGSDYDVRCASVGAGDTWSSQAAAVGTWVNMSITRTWDVDASGDDGTTKLTEATFEIRAAGGGPVLATADYDCFAESEQA